MLPQSVTDVTPLTETSVLPGLGFEDLRPDLIARARARGESSGEAGLSDEEFLTRAGLAGRDPRTGETGLFLPALLLFGRDDALRGALPEHGTIAFFRDGRRRATRETIRTNLLDTFDRLMAFAARHLPAGAAAGHENAPDDLRDLVLAEIFLNSLLHRAYAKPFPALFGIEPGRVYLENGSLGAVTAKEGAGRARNPVLARAFARLGWTRAPGIASPLARWGRAYFGMQPMTFDGSTYRLVAAYPPQGEAGMQVEPRKPPERARAKAPATEAFASAPTTPKVRPTIRELEVMLSEALPPFTPALEDLEPAAWDAPAPAARPAFAVRWEEAGPSQAPSPAAAPKAAPVPDAPARSTTEVAPTTPPAPPPVTIRPTVAPTPAPTPSIPAAPPASGDRTERILKFCETPRHRAEIQEFAGFQNRDYFRKEILNPLIEQGLLAPTLPDKPNSPNQQYRTVRAS